MHEDAITASGIDRRTVLKTLGAAAQAAYDQSQNPQIDCIPVASPLLMLYSNIFEVSIEEERGPFHRFERAAQDESVGRPTRVASG